ncbi:MAG: hypothetical protein LBT05_07150 [Planctomycetaceae bacterium]|nr:hypothetical protein [Planctomycetaceae bacterium]
MIPKRFLFNFSFPCRYVDALWTAQGTTLDKSYRLPDVSTLEDSSAEKNGKVDFRMGWNPKGLAFSVRVEGKKRRPWCRVSRPEDSDGIQICIDTRDVRNIHRASRFCHRLFILPGGSGANQSQPTPLWLPINRAKAHPNPVPVERMQLGGQIADTMYRLDFAIPAGGLTGYEPLEYNRIGFHYAIIDQEIGNRAFLVGFPFPHSEDPSVWATLELLPKE